MTEASSFWKPLLRKTGTHLSCSETFSGGLFTAHCPTPPSCSKSSISSQIGSIHPVPGRSPQHGHYAVLGGDRGRKGGRRRCWEPYSFEITRPPPGRGDGLSVGPGHSYTEDLKGSVGIGKPLEKKNAGVSRARAKVVSISGPHPLIRIPLSPHFFPLLSKGREKTKGGRDGERK